MKSPLPAQTSGFFGDVRHLHPHFRFCGEQADALLRVRKELLEYVFALLKEIPYPAPQVSDEAWTALLEALKPHWALPLLYWCAGHAPREVQPPPRVMAFLRGSFQWSRLRSLYMDRQLQELSTAFRQSGVRMIILKGAALGRMVYPDPALRPGSDLDILVRPGEMQHARVVLEKLGYEVAARKFGTDAEALYHHEEYTSTKRGGQNRVVELHWRLHSLGVVQDAGVDDLFEHAVQVSVHGVSFEALHPVDALIHRALNNAFMHDHDLRIIWVFDIFRLAGSFRGAEDWQALQERCVTWNARLAVEVALTLARSWYGLALPGAFEDFSSWPEATEDEIWAWRRITLRRKRLDCMLGAKLFPEAGMLERVWSVIRLLIPPRAVVVESYPVARSWMFPLAYLRRWGRWIRELRE